MIFEIYSREKTIIADGVDQFVRDHPETFIDNLKTNKSLWAFNLENTKYHTVSLNKSLRLKSNICQVVTEFAKNLNYNNWNLSPEEGNEGGKVIIFEGDLKSEKIHNAFIKLSQSGGNKIIDSLILVPPKYVKFNKSILSDHYKYKVNHKSVWDACNPYKRDLGPQSLDDIRILQYESCRGLEGWITVCFGLDEFWNHKYDQDIPSHLIEKQLEFIEFEEEKIQR